MRISDWSSDVCSSDLFARSRSGRRRGSMARILVAEDEVPVREFIRRALEHRGHEVVAVADGADALVKLNRGPFDMLLTDIGMTNMDGVELALKVARDWPDLAEIGKAHGRTTVTHAQLVCR